MTRIPILFILLPIAFPLAAEAEWSGRGNTGLALSRWDDPRWKSQWYELKLEFRSRGDDLEWLASAEAEMDLLNRTEEASLDEIWLDYRSCLGRWTVGRQRIRWGQSLALPVLDILCPSDYRDLFSGRADSDPLPVWSLRWQLDSGSALTEMVYIPEFRPARYLPGALPAAEIPRITPGGGEWGARSRFFLPFGDLGLAAFYGWDDLPAVTLDPGTGLAAEYFPYWLIGWDGAFPAGPFLIRLENGWDLNRSFSRLDGEPLVSSRVSALVGADWIASGWTVTLEVYGAHRFEDRDNALDDADQIQIAFEGNRNFSGGRWEPGVRGLWLPLDGDWYLNPRLAFRPTEGMEVEGGAEIPRGDSGLFSMADGEAAVYLRCGYTF